MEPPASKADFRRAILQAKTYWYIVDFYAPTARLVVEVDGWHHFDTGQASYDKQRSEYLEGLGFKVLRFDDRQVLTETESVVEEIFRTVSEKTLLDHCERQQP